MTSSSDVQSLAEVPERSVPLQLRIASALNSLTLNLCLRKDGTLNRSLANRMDAKAATTPKPVDGVSSKDVICDQGTKQFIRIFKPWQEQEEPKGKLPLLIYFHGGGFCLMEGHSKIFDGLARALAKACHVIVVSVNYRSAPEFRYPTAYEDCFQAIRWIQSDFQSGNGELSSIADPSQCFLEGDSAGGNIAHFMMVRAAQNDLSPLKIKGVLLMSPFFGGLERSPAEIKSPNRFLLSLWVTDWFWSAYLPLGSDRDHPACNVVGLQAEDISGLSLPPILIMIGSMDILQDWQQLYVEKLKEMGKQVQVKYTDFYHGEYIFPEGTKKVTAFATEFIKSLIH